MKHLFHIILVLLALNSGSCTFGPYRDIDYEKNKKELTRIYTKQRTHKSIAGETGVENLVWYFDKNGDEHDIFQAHYVMADYYRYSDEAQKSYLEYRKLLKLFPEQANAEEKDVMRCVYSNLQSICREANDFKLMWRWWEEAQKSGLYDGGDLYMLLGDKAWNFSAESKIDSCEKYMQLTFENLLRYPEWNKNKEGTLSDQKIYYAINGNDFEYRKRDSLAKMHPYENDRKIDIGFSFLKKGLRDSADIYFIQEVNEGGESMDVACIELAISAKKRNDIGSLFLYFQKYVDASEINYAKHRKIFSGHLDVIYENNEQEMKIAEYRIRVLAFNCVLAFAVLIAIAGWYGAYLYRKRMLLEQEKTLHEKQRTENLELKLKEAMESQAIVQTEEAEKRKATLLQNIDEVLMKLKMCAEKGNCDKDSLFMSIMNLHAEYVPLFSKSITLKYPKASFTDLLLCMLVVHGLSQREISVLFEQDRQKVRSNMLRISKNLTGKSVGRMEDFKALLETYLV